MVPAQVFERIRLALEPPTLPIVIVIPAGTEKVVEIVMVFPLAEH
jgi:hypothetical protein